MALPFQVQYATAINASIQGSRGISTSVNNLVEIPDGAQAGAITVTVLTHSTSSALVDGTVLTNDTATTEVVLTYVDNAVTLSLSPSQVKAQLTSPRWMEAIQENHASALTLDANNAVVADFVAGTPGLVETLAAARIDFAPGTDAQNDVMFGQVIKLIVYLQTNMQKVADMNEFGIIMGTTALGNFTTLKTTRRSYEVIMGPDGINRFMGIPLYGTTITTSFGGAGNDCAYIYHKNAEALAFKDPGLLNGRPFIAGDGYTKWTTVAPFAAGLVNATLLTSILNPAS